MRPSPHSANICCNTPRSTEGFADELLWAPLRSFDDITRLVSTIFRAPIALVSLVEQERQWFKSVVGLQVSGAAAQSPKPRATPAVHTHRRLYTHA